MSGVTIPLKRVYTTEKILGFTDVKCHGGQKTKYLASIVSFRCFSYHSWKHL